MTKFADAPYFVLKGLTSSVKPYGYVYPNKGILKSVGRNIVTTGGYGIDVWLQVDTGYVKLNLIPVSGTPTGNDFNFYLSTTGSNSSHISLNELGVGVPVSKYL